MMLGKFPLNDDRRERLRDDRLWVRTVQRANLFNIKRVHCPCCECQGRSKLLLPKVREHLIRHGRDPTFRVWKGPDMRDSSDEEWQEHMRRSNQRPSQRLDPQVNTRGMVENAFIEEPLPEEVEEIVRAVVTDAFIVGDSVTEECREGSSGGDGGNLPDPVASSDEEVDTEGNGDRFDPAMLEEAIQELYAGSRSTKLAATILLMNLCTVHGVSNNFVDELFTILHRHLLPEGNYLPRNHYTAKILTSKLGLTYNSIHACAKGCVLFRGEYVEAERCPKRNGLRFSDGEQKMYPAIVLRHFSIIPRLQRMFRSLAISELMRWHAENASDKEGGDGLVRHPCDSKAWKHFHQNVDPTFSNDPRNVHFVLAADGVNPFK
jgi:hypothetical protein